MTSRDPARSRSPLQDIAGKAGYIISGEDDAVGAQFEYAKIADNRRLGLGRSGRDENCGERD